MSVNLISSRAGLAGAAAIVAWLVGHASTSCAQGVEVTPLAGYGFGGDLFELVTEQPVDLDGAVAAGVVVDVPLGAALQSGGFFSHQQADVFVGMAPVGRATVWTVAVDHLQAGGLQELGSGQIRPFLTGMLVLTRYAAEADSEIRFSLSAGGGVKVFPT